MSEPRCAAVIVASGSARRLGFDKLLWPLHGLPVLAHTIQAMLQARQVTSLVVVCPLERWQQLPPIHTTKPVWRVDGGAERQDSVACGLAALPDDVTHVAVHDGARPLVAPDDVDHCIDTAFQHGAAVLAHPAVDTMKLANAEGFCSAPVSREQVWCMETPQVFRVDWLRQAFAKIQADGLAVTDEVSAAMHAGLAVKLVAATRSNPKITHQADLALATALAASLEPAASSCRHA